MKQLWHKAKALFGFGPQEAETPPPTAEDIAAGWESESLAQARAALAPSLFKDEHGYYHRTSWEVDHLNPAE